MRTSEVYGPRLIFSLGVIYTVFRKKHPLIYSIITLALLGRFLYFLRASAMLKHVIAIGLTSVRPSVRPSVTRWCCIKTVEHIVMLSSPHDSPFILVLCVSKIFAKFQRGHALRGRQTEVGYDKTGNISETRRVDRSIDRYNVLST